MYLHDKDNLTVPYRRFIKQIKEDPLKIDDNRFIFFLQCSSLLDRKIYHEFLYACKDLIKNNLKIHCFQYIKQAKAESILKVSNDLGIESSHV